jgi:hypothetical protein
MAGDIFSLCHFFSLAKVSTAAHSSSASRQLAQPFVDSFGIATPHSFALLLAQDLSSSGKSFSLHRGSRGRHPLPSVSRRFLDSLHR